MAMIGSTPKRASTRRFVSARKGGVAVIATLIMALVVVSGTAAVDYGRASDLRSQLQRAADSGVLAATQTQLVMPDANRENVARAFVARNIDADVLFQIEEIDVTGDGFARLTLVASIETWGLRLVGRDAIEVRVAAQAEFLRPRPLEMTFAIDNSPSMLLGATQADIDRMESEFNCAFACHWPRPGQAEGTYGAAQDLGIGLRLGAARDAVISASRLAENSAFSRQSDVFFDLYAFSRDLSALGRAEVGAAVESKVSAIEPEPKADSRPYEMTDPVRSLASFARRVGTKIEEAPEKDHFAIVITDGVADYAAGPRIQRAFSTDDCAALREAGATVAVIYTTYLPIPSNNWWRTHIDPFDEQIAPNLESCADEGWYFEARFEEDIEAALLKIMDRAIPNPLLTQ